MNAVVSLCHFCEIHGPSVLLSTQPCRSADRSKNKNLGFYGPAESLQSTNFSSTVSCEVGSFAKPANILAFLTIKSFLLWSFLWCLSVRPVSQ